MTTSKNNNNNSNNSNNGSFNSSNSSAVESTSSGRYAGSVRQSSASAARNSHRAPSTSADYLTFRHRANSNHSYRGAYHNNNNNNHQNSNNGYYNNGYYGGMSSLLSANRYDSSCPANITQLNTRQVERLRSVLQQSVEIHGRENFPTLRIPSLQKFIVHVKRKIEEANLHVKHVKLNGGAASYVLATADNFAYSDVDLIFPISLADEKDFDKVRTAVFDTLLELMPESTNVEMIGAETLKDVYIRKMIRVLDSEHRWSLFSLHNHYGRCIELKFVDKMSRQFEFSVDSFQITLDRLLERIDEPRPAVQAESMYGDFCQALSHLNRRLIDTRNPEEIRGGGLLKYCHLLTRGYRATYNCRDMEKYMCSRFFIDFPDISAQEAKLCSYLDNHFGAELEMKLDYLQVLYRVIKESTVCLMSHERRQTLAMVEHLRNTLHQCCYYGGAGGGTAGHQQQPASIATAQVSYGGTLAAPTSMVTATTVTAHNGSTTIYYSSGTTTTTADGGVAATPVYFLSPAVTPTVLVDYGVGAESAVVSPAMIFTPSQQVSPTGGAAVTADSTAASTHAAVAGDKSPIASYAEKCAGGAKPKSPASEHPTNATSTYTPRQTLLYLPPNATGFELIGMC